MHLILAMADYKRDHNSEALAELAQGGQSVEIRFRAGLDRGKAEASYWFDWVYARHLLQEASALIDRDSAQPAAE
jgi:hypothetical protein